MRKIAIIGSFSTGKTTLAQELDKQLENYILITDIERKVLKERWNEDFKQRFILSEQIRQEYRHREENQLHDNSLIITLAYSKHILNDEDYQADFIRTANYLKHYPYTKLFLLPLELKIEDDGIRHINKEFQIDIHETILDLCNELKIKPIIVKGSLEERIQFILKNL